MNNAKVLFKIKINKGKNAGNLIPLLTDIEELEEESISSLLIEKGYLETWCNNGEYSITEREIHIEDNGRAHFTLEEMRKCWDKAMEVGKSEAIQNKTFESLIRSL